MSKTVLITGGAGFIGRHLARALLAQGRQVRVLDSLIEQVHPKRERPAELDAEVELVIGDVRDEAAVLRALSGVDQVVHLAAEVGVGQSMYAVDRYTSVNDYGTAVLFQQLIDNPVERVVVASSMSIYGEGLYRTVDGALAEDVTRGRPQSRRILGPAGRAGPAADPRPDARDQAERPEVGLRHRQVRAGAADPDPDPAVRHAGRGPATVERVRPRARRSPTPIPACWRSSPRGSPTARRR
jgi:dTDP-L-rhamnose 4-epimerase